MSIIPATSRARWRAALTTSNSSPTPRSTSCPIRGTAAMREMWTTIKGRYSEMRCEVPIIVAEDDKVAANIRVFFRKSSNARMVQFDIAAFYTFRDGRIAQIREIIDTFDMVEQVL